MRAGMRMETVGVWYLSWDESCTSGPVPPQLTDRKKYPTECGREFPDVINQIRKLVDLTVWSLIFSWVSLDHNFPTLASA
jgi:hypothetical protein